MDDVLFQDNDVCILNPKSKRGVLVYYAGIRQNICEDGLLSYNEARKYHPEIRPRPQFKGHNDIIKLRAPFTSNLSSFKTSYKVEPRELMGRLRPEVVVVIRIDPDKSFVYSSEARTHLDEKALAKSRIPFNEYIKRIAVREKMHVDYPAEICSNIATYETKFITPAETCIYPWIKYLPIERNGEVAVHLPRIPPEWFVSCQKNSVKPQNVKPHNVKTRRKKRAH